MSDNSPFLDAPGACQNLIYLASLCARSAKAEKQMTKPSEPVMVTFGSLTRAQKQMVRYVYTHPHYRPRSGHKERVMERLVSMGVLIEEDDGSHSVAPAVYRGPGLHLNPQCVYALSVIEPDGSYGPTKFGTGNPGRPTYVQNASPYPLKIVVIVPGAYDEETKIHRRLKNERTQGEWFHGPKTRAQVQRMLEAESHASNCPCARCRN